LTRVSSSSVSDDTPLRNGLPLPEMTRTHEYRQYSLERFVDYIDLREQARLGFQRNDSREDTDERKDGAKKHISVLKVSEHESPKSGDDLHGADVREVVESKEEKAHAT
jgi:hypothetical protein